MITARLMLSLDELRDENEDFDLFCIKELNDVLSVSKYYFNLPMVCIGMELWIPFENCKGEKDSLTVSVSDITFDVEKNNLLVGIELRDPLYSLVAMLSPNSHNGWELG